MQLKILKEPRSGVGNVKKDLSTTVPGWMLQPQKTIFLFIVQPHMASRGPSPVGAQFYHPQLSLLCSSVVAAQF